jgi:hypothetical protein
VRAAGYAQAEGEIGTPEADGGTEEVVFRLVRPATLTMRCVDGAGRPLLDVVVLAESTYEVAERCLGVDRATAETHAPAGRATLELAPGEPRIECWRAGARVLELDLPALRAGEARDLGNLVMAEAKSLCGTVRTAAGAPAAGAFVVVVPHDDDDTEHDALAVAVIDPRRGDRVDSAGRFEVRGLLPGLWDLLVHGGGHPRLLRVGLAVPEAGEPPALDLRLPEAVKLEGRVVDAAGRPVPGASIAFQRSWPIAPNLVEEVVADGEGRFSIPGFTREDRDVELRVAAPGSEASQDVLATPRDGPVEVRLP